MNDSAIPVIKMRPLPTAISPSSREEIRSLLHTLAQNLCNDQNNIQVSYVEGDKTTVYRIEVPTDLRGRLIGANGKTINALRVLLAAVAGTHGFRAVIDLVL